MLDIGWSELLLIGVVALIVVGPKDLPVMFRTLGRFTAKARAMAREFQRAMDDAAKSTGVHETLKDVRDLTSKKSLGITALESAADKFEKWNPMKPEAKPASPTPKLAGVTPPPMPSEQPVAAAAAEMGPATKALADKVARQRQERLEKVAPPAETAAEDLADGEPDLPRPKRTRAAKAVPEPAAEPAAKPAKPAARSVATKAAAAPAPAPARKPRTKKSDA